MISLRSNSPGHVWENDNAQLPFFFQANQSHSVFFLFFFADIKGMYRRTRDKKRIFAALAEVGCVSRRAAIDSRGYGYGYLQIATDSEALVKPAAVTELKQPVEVMSDTSGLGLFFFSSFFFSEFRKKNNSPSSHLPSLPHPSVKPTVPVPLLFLKVRRKAKETSAHASTST